MWGMQPERQSVQQLGGAGGGQPGQGTVRADWLWVWLSSAFLVLFCRLALLCLVLQDY